MQNQNKKNDVSGLFSNVFIVAFFNLKSHISDVTIFFYNLASFSWFLLLRRDFEISTIKALFEDDFVDWEFAPASSSFGWVIHLTLFVIANSGSVLHSPGGFAVDVTAMI